MAAKNMWGVNVGLEFVCSALWLKSGGGTVSTISEHIQA